MKYAYNNNGVLQDVVMSNPSMIFPAGYAEQFIQVPDHAQNGWLWGGQNATEPPQPESELNPIEVRAAAVRVQRNQKLAETDWMMLPDAATDKAAVAAYRQALRDVPSQPGFPFNVEWPTL
jgi:Phage tail assembly chaperone protein